MWSINTWISQAQHRQVEDVKKFLEDPDAYAAANPVAAAPAASGGGEAKKEEKKAGMVGASWGWCLNMGPSGI